MKSHLLRILSLSILGFFWGFSSSFATKYYVSQSAGSDANSSIAAQTLAFPWQTVAFAISQTVNGDSIVVLPGTYTETNIGINKSIKLFGNETAGLPGSGSKPVFNGTSAAPGGSIFILQASGIVIQNFELQVNQVDVIRGIFCNGGGYNRLQVLDNHIFSSSSLAPTIFNSYGIQLGTTSIQANQDSFLISRNTIKPLTAGSALFGRGIRLVGGFGLVGGIPSDSNFIAGDYGIQAGDIKSRLQIMNNHIFGISAGLELNIPAANRTHTITGNKFEPNSGFNSLCMIELKNNTLSNSIVQISANQFIGHPISAIFSTRSRNVIVDGNTFIPSDTSQNYIHIAVNNKQQTTANDAATASSITVTANDFRGNSALKGTAIAFQNHNSGVNPPFPNTTIGGSGVSANTFSAQVGRFVILDTASGPSTQNPLWNQAGYKITLMRPVNQSLDLTGNAFDLGSGPQLPSAMSESNLLELENRILHGVDYDSLGFVMVKNQTVILTQSSFVSPLSTTPSLQRAVNQVGSNDGWSILSEAGTYPGRVQVATDLTLDVANDLTCGTHVLEMNGVGKVLSLNNIFQVSDSLKLTSGKIAIGPEDLEMSTSAVLSGGSQANYIQTNGTGTFTYAAQNGTPRLYPVGTISGYFPLTIANSGTPDQLGIRVQADVLSGGLSGTPVDSVVGATWVASEGTSGGSNLSVSASWPGTAEKPFFIRSNTHMQGFIGGWNLISNSPVTATGTDPFSATYTGISNGLSDMAMRIRTVAAPLSTSKLYYVDDNTGSDSRTNNEAKDPATPWQTIAKALASCADGDSIQVLAGTYTEFDLLINKKLTILGNVVGVGVGVGAGTGVRPIVNGIGPSPLDSSIFIVKATDINIRNFNIKVDQVNIKLGINAPTTGFTRLVIEDNLIESTGDIFGNNDVVVLSHAILLGRLSSNGADSIIVRRNTINREGPGKKWFSRGVRWWGGLGMVGGNNPTDGNEVHADFAIQIGGGNLPGRIQTRNNTVFGRAAGVEYNTLSPSSRHTIANNTIRPLDLNGHFALIEIKSNIRVTGPTSPAPPFIDIENNTLVDFYKIGVALTRSRKCNVVNNTFTPLADSTNYTHVWVNSKQRTAGSTASQQPLAVIETLIQGNTFNGNNVFGGYGVAFQNANVNATGKTFTVNDMGGAGSLANTFGPNIAKVVYLDTVTGRSDQNSFWSKPGINWVAWPNTPMGPVRDNFDFSGNLFDVGTGSKRPSEMTTSELFLLENRVVHKVDADTLGFVTMVPNQVYVTQQSFISPLTISPRLQRGVRSAGAVDGFTLNIETGNYSGVTTVSQNMTFDATPDGQVTSDDMGMNGVGKSLLLNDPFRITSSLRLENGLIDIAASDLSLAAGASVSGGSLASHVNTSGTGYFVHEDLSGSSKRYVVGTGTRYAETQLTNTGTTDNVGLKVFNDVLTSGSTGSAVDTVVGISYQLREVTQGGSNLTFSPTWSGVDERPFFNRNLVFVEQFNSGWQNIGPVAPSVATGSDPFSISAAISGNWNEQAVRVVGRSPAVIPTGTLYYVDDNTGQDSRSNAEAQNPNTPWQTLTKALASVANGDSIQVFDGTYPEANLTITKSINLFGNVSGIGVGVGAGTGIRPVVNGTSGTPTGSIFILQADSVLIQNFDIRVNQVDVVRGIFSNGPGFNKLRVLDNHIFSTSTLAPSIFNSYGIQLGTTSISAALDSFVIARNVIRPLTAGSALFGRGIRLVGGFGLIGGSTLADSNSIMGDYGVQAGDNRSTFQLRNNHISALSAGLELNIPAANRTHTVAGNKFQPVSGFNSLTMIEIKNNTRANSLIQITANQFVGHPFMGVFSTRSRNVTVDGNTFLPSDTALNFIHIAVNNKQQTTANDAATASSATITGNNFLGNSFLKGSAIAFQNHNSGVTPAFPNTVIGGAGSLANIFSTALGRFILLDTASGPSTQNPIWNQTGYKVTLMRPVTDDFDVRENLFDVGSGATLPAAMTETNLALLEDRILHGVDYDSLGFAMVKDQAVYVTQNSFIAPLTSTPSLQRAIDQVGTNDGWTLLAETGTYPGRAQVSTDLTLDVVNDLNCGTNTLQISGAGKTLTLNNDFLVSDSLKLTSGKVMLIAGNLQLQSGAILSGGNINSYVHTSGIGQFRYQSQGAGSKLYPVGTSSGYFPLSITNSGIADELGIRVQADVLDGGLTGAPVDSVVSATWVATEGIVGGSNLTVSATWNGTDEKSFFNRNQAFMQGFVGTWSNVSPSAVAATGSDPYSAVFPGITSNLASLPLRISSSQPQAAGNLYYVDNVSGQDTRTNAEAQDPTTPWKTIGKALSSTLDGDSIQVFAGNYPESNLLVNHSLKIFGNVVGIGTGPGAGTGIRPVVNGTTFGADSSIFTIRASDVLLRNFQIEVDQNLIINGVLAKTSDYDRVEIMNNRILSTGINPLPPVLPCLRFNTYGIRLAGYGTDSLLIQGNEIEPSALDGTRCVFGHGIKLLGGHGLIGGPNDLDSNRILAYYAIQAGGSNGGLMRIENNFTIGIGVQIVAPVANTGIHVVKGNNFFVAFPQAFPNIVELKDIQNPGTGVLVTENTIAGFSNAALFSQRNQNVNVVNNLFIPSDTARNYRHIVVNTKQETIASVQNPVPSSIQIKSNNFRANSVAGGAGTAIEFGNHNDDPTTDFAFTNIAIGGPGIEQNTFGQNLRNFVVLDPLSGQSSTVPFWSSYPPTTMVPVKDTFDISNNQFGVSGGVKVPSAMTDDELYEVEDKVSHAIDYDSLGFVKVKSAFAFVTDSSFLRPFHSAPSIQRAVNAASSDGWQVNVEPALIGETTRVNKSITFNTHPLDSIRLGGINMDGLDKTLTLNDKFILLNTLKLDNPNGGKIQIGGNDLVTLPTAAVSIGSINSYVVTDGAGSLVRRGVDDLATVFPVGTLTSYAPVLFDDANNTGDNFRIKVKPAATNADFTPPLPATFTTFVTFQWDICEDVPGGSVASLTFDWVDPLNINGSGIINGISRNDGTNWNSTLATINGLTATASGFGDFCSPFAVVADPNLTSITTENIIKIHPGVVGKYCVGDSVKIPFSVTGTGIIAGNTFNAFLSDADGTFPVTGGVLIGSLLSQVSDTVIGVIPIATPPGLNYHIRVVSTNIAITGIANPDSIKIFGLPARPTVSGDSVLCSGESTTFTSTTGTTYLWTPGGQQVQSITATTAGAYKVTVSDDNGCLNTSAIRNLTVNTSPVADTISYIQPLARCLGDSLILTANPSGLTYSWLNTTPTVNTQTLTVKASGTYQVVVSNASCSDTSAALVVTFNPLPAKPVITLTNPNDTICQPDTLHFQSSSAGQYDWSITGVTPNPSTQNVDVLTVGTHTATVTITDGNGCKNSSDPVTGVINQAPTRPVIGSLNNDLSVCEGDTIKLKASPFSNANTYTWQPGGFIGAEFAISAPGAVTVSVKVDSLGCSSTSLVNLEVNVNPRPTQPTTSITVGQNSFCLGDSVVLTSSTGIHYLWTPGSDTTQSITIKTLGGSYSVVTLSDSGCKSLPSAAIGITVRTVPSKPLISATKLTFCFGDESTISVTNPSASNTYTWTPAGSGTSIIVSATGTYSVKVDSTNNCSSSSDPIGITVNPLPEPIITAKNGRTQVCKGDSVVLFSNYSTGNVWSNNATSDSIVLKATTGITLNVTDQNSCSAIAGPIQVVVHSLPQVRLEKDTALVFPEDFDLVAVDLTNSAETFYWKTDGLVFDSTASGTKNIAPTKTGIYYVTLVDTNGCQAVDSVLVRVSRELYVPNVFSPNNDGKNDRFKVYGFGVVSIEVKVWDRLGNLVYETSDPDEIVETSFTDDSVKGWDGKYKDKELGQESYVWSVKGKLTTGEDIKVRGGKNSGSVILMN